jgi:uncharacterized protein YndB with AHSA1/START domain
MNDPMTKTSEVERRTVVLTREFTAEPARVFAAWTDLGTLTKWFGCATDMLWNVHAWDVRPGGDIHVSLDFDGTPYEVRGRFVVVDEPRRLQYEWEAGQMVTVTIEPVEQGSRLTLEHTGLPNEEMETIVTGGWTEAMVQILAVLG